MLAIEENGDRAGQMSPLLDSTNSLNFLSLTTRFQLFSDAL